MSAKHEQNVLDVLKIKMQHGIRSGELFALVSTRTTLSLIPSYKLLQSKSKQGRMVKVKVKGDQ